MLPDEVLNYWGGAAVKWKCACGMSDSCDHPNRKCHCGANDINVLREDSGHVTEKAALQVNQLRFGIQAGEYGYYTLDQLLSWI